MKTAKSLILAASAATLFGVAATARADYTFTLDFEGPGFYADLYTPTFLTIGYGEFVPSRDEWGDPIDGTDHWQLASVDDFGRVPVINPNDTGWGTAPSGSKALDARGGPVLLVFDTPISLSSFKLTLDNSTQGDLFDTGIKFYGADNSLLFEAPVDQTIPGYQVNVGPVNEVKYILLPPTAFYDNFQAQAIPEPSAALALLGGVGTLIGYRRRKS